jgi:hypothetical protein
MKKFVKLIGIVALAAIIGFSMAACGGDGDPSSPGGGGGGGGSSNPFVGTWTGNFSGVSAQLVFSASTVTLSFPEYPSLGSETFSYTYSGNTATMTSGGVATDTATISGSTLTLRDLSDGTTYTFTKQGGSSGSGGGQTGSGGNIVGRWMVETYYNACINMDAAIIEFKSNGTLEYMGFNGTYSVNGNQITAGLSGGNNTATATFSVSGNRLTISNTTSNATFLGTGTYIRIN